MNKTTKTDSNVMRFAYQIQQAHKIIIAAQLLGVETLLYQAIDMLNENIAILEKCTGQDYQSYCEQHNIVLHQNQIIQK